jgi:hypothetical protein
MGSTLRNILVLIGLYTLALALIGAMFWLLLISRSVWHGLHPNIFFGRILDTETLLIYLYVIPMFLLLGALSYRVIQSLHPHLWALALAFCFWVPWLIFIHDFAVAPFLTVAGSLVAKRYWGKRPGETTVS